MLTCRNFQVDANSTTKCKWPPSNPEDIKIADGYNITICVNVEKLKLSNDEPMKYQISELFKDQKEDKVVTFKELPTLPREMWKAVKYPLIYKTYPQDVPMKEILESIKIGHPIPYVSETSFK